MSSLFIASKKEQSYNASFTPLCHQPLPDWLPSMAAEPENLKCIVALITNYGCLPPAGFHTAAVLLIDDILEDSLTQLNLIRVQLSYIAVIRMMSFKIGGLYSVLFLQLFPPF